MGLVKAVPLPTRVETPATAPDVATGLAHPDPAVRREAIRLAVGERASGPLAARLPVESDEATRTRLIGALADIGDGVAIDALLDCLRGEDIPLRNGAIDALRTLPETAAPLIARLLNDPEPDVRIFGVNALEGLRHPDVETWLIDVIRDDEHVNVCAAAVELLGEIGSAAAIDPLEALKQRFPDQPFIGFAADVALDRIQPVSGAPR